MRKKSKKLFIIVSVCLFATAALCFGTYRLMNARNFQLFGKLVSRTHTDQKVVALTFDDGPSDKTPKILKVLRELDVNCTFFLTGQEIERHMDYARAIADAGHQLGNHTYFHRPMVFMTYSAIENEIESTNRLIREAGFTGEIVFRPPYCKKLALLPLVLQNKGIPTVTWDIEPDSFMEIASDPEKIVDHVLSQTQSGSIILLHVMYGSGENALNAIPGIVEGLRDMGYKFVTVNELLELAGN